jgi:NADPH:quinone reductase-like Zn-dependent oxidoreductase
MKVIELQNDFGIHNLQLHEYAKPHPAKHEILVRMAAVSLNVLDLLVVKGMLNPHISLPYVPVCDGAGIVEQVGDAVTAFQAGDHVASVYMPNWIDGQPTPKTADFATRPGAGGRAGQLAEYKVFQSHELIKVPNHLSSVEAATLPIAGLTAWNALRYGNLQAGDTVLLHGTGGVSIFALQFAKAQNARVILVSGNEEKLLRAQQLGLDFPINRKNHPNWETVVNDLTDQQGVDMVVESIGGQNLQKSIDALRIGGHISVMGMLDGMDMCMNALSLLIKQATIKGMEVGNAKAFSAMNHAIEIHQIHPVVDRIFSFDQAQAAFEYLDQKSHFGKVAIQL